MSGENSVSSEIDNKRCKEMVLSHPYDAYGLARWLTGNRTDAGDVVQDAHMRAPASMDSAVIDRPRAWLLTTSQYDVQSACELANDDDKVLEVGRNARQRLTQTRRSLNRRRQSRRATIGDRGAAATFQRSHRNV
jgi:DNA-directed RNA polymerase specialized sigma24 family protein